MKVLPFNIPKSKDASIIFQKDVAVKLYDKLHQHEEVQISFVIMGSGTLVVGDTVTTYKANDVFVFGSRLPHVFLSDTPASKDNNYVVCSIFFNISFLQLRLLNLPEFKKLASLLTEFKHGIVVLNNKSRLAESILQLEKAKDEQRVIIFLQLLIEIKKSKRRKLSNSVFEKSISPDEGKRIQDVFDYTLSNYQTTITLEQIAQVANLSKNAFCKYFKSRTNKTYFQFLIEIRIEKAAKMFLHHADLSVVEVLYACGFNNISNFNRQFKRIKGCNPLAYKKSYFNL
jgi:AraC-like DNA-binding protein